MYCGDSLGAKACTRKDRHFERSEESLCAVDKLARSVGSCEMQGLPVN